MKRHKLEQSDQVSSVKQFWGQMVTENIYLPDLSWLTKVWSVKTRSSQSMNLVWAVAFKSFSALLSIKLQNENTNDIHPAFFIEWHCQI